MSRQNPAEFEGFMEVNISKTALWCVTPYSLATDYTASHSRRQYFAYTKQSFRSVTNKHYR
jgi:hypothetical protein